MKITVDKQTLIEAQQSYNTAAFENPENFGEIELTEECAENQVNTLLYYLPEYHQEEVAAEIRTKIVAEFIDFCKLKGTQISDKLFEEFFGA